MQQSKTNFRIGKTNQLMIWASINGVTGNFIIDTGANRTCVDKECVEIFLMKAEKGEINASAIDAFISTSRSNGNQLQIGQTKIEVDIMIVDLSHLNRIIIDHQEKPIKGIIGSDVLMKTKAVIDYGEMCICLK